MKRILLAFSILTVFAITYSFTNSNSTSNPKLASTPGIGINVGDEAPEISMSALDGSTYALSELRGKVVLIDFWASWCGPCRRENPNVVGAYEKYKKAKFKSAKGFEVFSVSLDKQKEPWQQAVDKDQLKWKYHVSDLQGWSSPVAAQYGVSSIPMSFLIDENGIIVAKGLRGLELHKKLDEYVKSF